MNKAKVIEYLQNTFHCRYVEGQGLSLADWGIPEYISVEFYDDAISVDDLSFVPRFSDDKLAQQCMKIVAEVMSRAVRYTKYDEVNHILAFPYNCNFRYIKYIRDAIEMNEGEDDYDFYKRKRGVTNARKPIKSAYKGLDEEVGDLHIDMTNTGYFEDGWLLLEGENKEGYRDGTEFIINAYGPNGEDLGSKKFDFLELWHNGKPVNSSIQSSMQGQEKGIQAIMDEYGCTREEAIDIMNSEVTSGCHGKAKKKNKKEIKSSDIEIESSTERNANNLNKIFG